MILNFCNNLLYFTIFTPPQVAHIAPTLRHKINIYAQGILTQTVEGQCLKVELNFRNSRSLFTLKFSQFCKKKYVCVIKMLFTSQ